MEPGLLKKESGLFKLEEPGMRIKKEPGMREKEPGLLNKEPGAGAALPDGADTERLDDKNRVQSTEDKVKSTVAGQQARRVGVYPSPRWAVVRLEVG